MRWNLLRPGAILVASFVLSTPCDGVAQSTADWTPPGAPETEFSFTIRNIMRGPEHIGEAPSQVRWTDDSRWVYFTWKPGGQEWQADRSLYRVSARGGSPELLDDEAAREVEPLIASGDISRDGRWRVSSVEGDLYLVARGDMTLRRLTQTADSEGDPLFSDDGERVLFRRGNDLYRIHLETGALEQLTRIVAGSPPAEEAEAEGQRGFLETQQLELFEHVRIAREEEALRERRREAREAGVAATVYIRPNERVRALEATRDGKYALLSVSAPPQGAEQTVVPEWVTEDGYTRDLTVRTKVGDAQGESRVGVITVATGAVAWLEVEPEGYEADHPAGVSGSGWNDAGTRGWITSVSYDNKDRWLWSLDPATGEITLLDHLHDDAWVAGPCSFGCTGFLPGTDRVYFASEESGYAHLYAVNSDGSGKRALTSGNWEVLGATIPRGAGRFLLSTNEGSPFNEHVWWMDFDGARREAVTRGEGRYDVTISPDRRRFAVVHDVANHPPELYLAAADDVAGMTRVTTTPTAEWSTFPWRKPEIVHFTAEDGTRVPARIYRPAETGAASNGAAVIFVHGAGYLHNVHDYWSSYSREYMFNHFLAASGYTVLDVDYRGSAGYGRDWRTAIYRWMGGKDLSDQVDGARYLVEHEGVDAGRIGLYGGSYGGFITLMGLFTAGETFRSGAALRSVTDWAHYNHGYTSRILNLPHEDEEAYRKSSPIYFAENFREDQNLLILHGMVDTNVHFSDVVRLAQRLIELGKENWEFAVYPVENHGFVEPASWTDEYRRIFELFERTLREPGCTQDGGLCDLRRAGG
ncbi:MAG: prolyl oligopeptidase family serine peptidase [Gemmatimonadota bacterium]|nr:prolyl oligopeptidase family serine peptidase [Gemmatimonadota bacterium]MDH5760335.1 prolyl oligopeptidase family serine peptidase [Gemmatimonadota bacterium]